MGVARNALAYLSGISCDGKIVETEKSPLIWKDKDRLIP
jgi:hypothetical protein